ncbi:putative ABC transport system ATP-binding protein [Allocatelliglobosispora scoriae]|uniref:Putative ABC transport system ATP-binding protein n=1 Tax=Allocatelliglobosispora scoriae TaxID=643052 RepID=A0A841BT42_9ACTN|nr:ABC transporter ATP-binding protein [Allocatelliglobosispora scoriae]MBB5869971.1 putative ABC transport system ATP-binding protein [Allocatelliglobosispora scoriae]
MAEPLLALASVTRTYPGPPAVTALRDANLTIHGGEMVAIVGPSGSGKSTLLNILGLLDEPTSGVRMLAGVDTSVLSDRDRTALRATRLGFVFQSFHLVPYLDCVANVTLPLTHQGFPRQLRRDLAVTALTTVGLGHRLSARPATLSGGEQQRVAIARAIVHEPALLLCDEPTGNLDSENTEAILDLLRRMVTGSRAVVVVTHESYVRDRADRAVEVVDGHVYG